MIDPSSTDWLNYAYGPEQMFFDNSGAVPVANVAGADPGSLDPSGILRNWRGRDDRGAGDSIGARTADRMSAGHAPLTAGNVLGAARNAVGIIGGVTSPIGLAGLAAQATGNPLPGMGGITSAQGWGAYDQDLQDAIRSATPATIGSVMSAADREQARRDSVRAGADAANNAIASGNGMHVGHPGGVGGGGGGGISGGGLGSKGPMGGNGGQAANAGYADGGRVQAPRELSRLGDPMARHTHSSVPSRMLDAAYDQAAGEWALHNTPGTYDQAVDRAFTHGLINNNMASGGIVGSKTPGRSDAVPMRVRRGSYVIPADVVSSMGQGNTMAGAKRLDGHVSRLMERAPPHLQRRGYAAGGAVGDDGDATDIQASGGEYVVPPEAVATLGNGSLEHGTNKLDALITSVRQQTAHLMHRLPGPR